MNFLLTFSEDTKINLRKNKEIKIFYAWFCIIFEEILIEFLLSSKMMNEHNLKRVFSSSTTWLIHKRFIRAEFFNIQHNNSTFQVINQILMEIPWHRSSTLNSNWVRMKKIDETTVKLKKMKSHRSKWMWKVLCTFIKFFLFFDICHTGLLIYWV